MPSPRHHCNLQCHHSPIHCSTQLAGAACLRGNKKRYCGADSSYVGQIIGRGKHAARFRHEMCSVSGGIRLGTPTTRQPRKTLYHIRLFRTRLSGIVIAGPSSIMHLNRSTTANKVSYPQKSMVCPELSPHASAVENSSRKANSHRRFQNGGRRIPR